MALNPEAKAVFLAIAQRLRSYNDQADRTYSPPDRQTLSELGTRIDNLARAEPVETAIGNSYPLADLIDVSLRLNRPVQARRDRELIKEKLQAAIEKVIDSPRIATIAGLPGIAHLNGPATDAIEARLVEMNRQHAAQLTELQRREHALETRKASVDAQFSQLATKERALNEREYTLNARLGQSNAEREREVRNAVAERLEEAFASERLELADREEACNERAAALDAREAEIEGRVLTSTEEMLANADWRRDFVAAHRWEGLKGHWRYYELLGRAADIHNRKNQDYAGDGDPLQNLRESEGFGIPAWKACLIRISDKYSRIRTLTKKGEENAQVVDEAVDDTLLDMANYALLTVVLREEDRQRELAAAEASQARYTQEIDGLTLDDLMQEAEEEYE